MKEEFYSQFGEDKWLVENKILPEKGFFLDIGAGDYKNLSNTYYLEQHGWDGICIDADPRQLPGLIEHRNHVVIGAANDFNGLTKFFINKTLPDISRINPGGNEVQVGCASFTIPHLLFQLGLENLFIDLVSIDIEGSETVVLENMFLNNIFPGVIIVEFNTSGVNHAESIEKLMKQYKYTLIYTTEANFIYKLK